MLQEGVFSDHIPDPRPPIVVFLIEQQGCGACEEYHPVFVETARKFAERGLTVVRVDATTEDPETVKWMNVHGVQSTPTVIAASLYRGPVARLEGVSSALETHRLFAIAWAHNRS